jgi:ribosomal-protein-alanine N-acetyltransferase
MTEFRFHLGTENDRDFVSQLSARVFSVYGRYDEIVANWLLQPSVVTVVITKKAEPLGFAMLEFKGKGGRAPSSGELLAIAIVPEYQGLGIGNALLTHTESLALQYESRGIQLHTGKDNLSARSFFEKAGYKVIGSRKRYYPRGQPALAMYKTLIP